MQINRANVAIGKTIQESTGSYQNPKVENVEKDPNITSECLASPDVDTYTPSNGEKLGLIYDPSTTAKSEIKVVCTDENSAEYNYGLDLERQWAEAQEKYKDEPFKLYQNSQHMVFENKLEEMGFFEGMSKETASQLKSLLKDITQGMSSISPETGWGGIFGEGDESKDTLYLSSMTSDEGRMSLESATAALHFFSEKYLSDENKADFDTVVDDFYAHNTKVLEYSYNFTENWGRTAKRVQASIERFMEKGGDVQEMYSAFEKLGVNVKQTGTRGQLEISLTATEEMNGFDRYMVGVNHSEEEEVTYWNNFAEMLKKIQQVGGNLTDFWEQLKEGHIDFLTKGTERQDIRERVEERIQNTFGNMEEYWKKLLESE